MEKESWFERQFVKDDEEESLKQEDPQCGDEGFLDGDDIVESYKDNYGAEKENSDEEKCSESLDDD